MILLPCKISVEGKDRVASWEIECKGDSRFVFVVEKEAHGDQRMIMMMMMVMIDDDSDGDVEEEEEDIWKCEKRGNE